MTARRDPLTPAWNRRTFLRTGGLTVAAGALVAACGDRGGSTGIPRVGTVPSTTALPTVGVTDVALLRTATSLEYNLMFAYDLQRRLAAANAKTIAVAAPERAPPIIATSYAACVLATLALAAVTSRGSGGAFNCANLACAVARLAVAVRS